MLAEFRSQSVRTLSLVKDVLPFLEKVEVRLFSWSDDISQLDCSDNFQMMISEFSVLTDLTSVVSWPHSTRCIDLMAVTIAVIWR